MKIRKFIALMAISSVLVSNGSAFASNNKILRVSVLDAGSEDVLEVADFDADQDVEVTVDGETVDLGAVADAVAEGAEQDETIDRGTDACGYEAPEEPLYGASFVSIRKKLLVETGEVFRVRVFMKNTGNTPWFAGDSRCDGPRMSLGTMKEQDSASEFYASNLEGVEHTGWESNNRVRLDQYRVDPGQIGSFTFWSQAPSDPDIMKQYMAPVLAGIAWIEDAEFDFDLMVGDTGETHDDIRKRFFYGNNSGSLMDIPINGRKNFVVDVSEQNLYLKLDDYVFAVQPVSSGKPATPTPLGEVRIGFIQEVRIAAASPYYIMPWYTGLEFKQHNYRFLGYGFHALPSLGSASLRAKIKNLQREGKDIPATLYADDGLWTEALDHITEENRRGRSHGCIRLLPDVAKYLAQNFWEPGLEGVVQQ